jgi:catechol 2,3-dioxygenase-like lactoylglutathione lyase family enzyme
MADTVTAPVVGFHHFSIACADTDRSLAFYGRFGMEVVSDRVVEPGGYVERVTGVQGARVRINLELLEYLEPRGDTRARSPNDAGSAHLCFIVGDCDAVCAELRELGVTVRSAGGRPQTVTGGPNDGGKCVYLDDPDGNPVELVQLVRPWPTGS